MADYLCKAKHCQKEQLKGLLCFWLFHCTSLGPCSHEVWAVAQGRAGPTGMGIFLNKYLSLYCPASKTVLFVLYPSDPTACNGRFDVYPHIRGFKLSQWNLVAEQLQLRQTFMLRPTPIFSPNMSNRRHQLNSFYLFRCKFMCRPFL